MSGNDADDVDRGDERLVVGEAKASAARLPCRGRPWMALAQMGDTPRHEDAAATQPGRRVRLPGLRWPEDAGRPQPAEFCENGMKAVAEEATTRRIGRSSSPPTPSRAVPPATTGSG